MWHWYNRVTGETATSPRAMDTHTHTHIVVSELSAHFGKTAAWQRSSSHPAWEELRSGPSANAGSLCYHRSMCVSLCEGGRPTSLITDWELDKFEASIKTNTSRTPTLKANSPSQRKTQNVWHKRPPQSFQKNIYHLHPDYYIECIALDTGIENTAVGGGTISGKCVHVGAKVNKSRFRFKETR